MNKSRGLYIIDMPKYLKNADLLEEIKLSFEQDKLTKEAERMLILLVDRMILRMTYYDDFVEDHCRSTAYYHLFRGWKNFDVNRGTNAFAYYTEIAKRGLAFGYNELFKLKGTKEANEIQHFSIERTNSERGNGMFNV